MNSTFLPSFGRGLCLLALCFASISCDKGSVSPAIESNQKQFAPNFVLAKTNSELELLHKDANANFIRTREQFEAFLASGACPLSKLPQDVQNKFVDKLVFRDSIGVVGLEFADIKSLLSYDEFAQVLAAFGLDVKQGYWGLSQDPTIIAQLSEGGSTTNKLVDDQVIADHAGYYCSPIDKHSCYLDDRSICLSGC